MMMRKSVSHPQPAPQPTSKSPVSADPKANTPLGWCLLVAVGALTVLTGIAILIALMSPENLRTAPTIALVAVLVLLCVPVPVLMLERSHRKNHAIRAQLQEQQQVKIVCESGESTLLRNNRSPVLHQSHSQNHLHPHTASHTDSHTRPLKRHTSKSA